jgi:23S rRNA (adenine2503-C2)-methyltransferase
MTTTKTSVVPASEPGPNPHPLAFGNKGSSSAVPDGGAQRERLLDLTFERLAAELSALGQPTYRARQVYEWLHLRNVWEPELMSDLPKALRSLLSEKFDHRPLKLLKAVRSSDKSVKYVWKTSEGHPVEAVLMPYRYATALCVSAQSGCPMACKFCQTGYMGLRSWLSAGQILQQLYQAERESGLTVERIVFMGMGEPLLNLRALRRVVEILTGPGGRAWAPRRITVSTVGLAKPMRLLADSFPRVNLALSLHSTDESWRRSNMPHADWKLSELMAALYYYRQMNGGKISLEYTLIAGSNDSDADAQRLVYFAHLRGLPAGHELVVEASAQPLPSRAQPLPLHVNLISYNPISGAPQLRGSGEARIDYFAQTLRASKVPVTVRRSRGADVGGACGQLGSEAL